MSWLSENYDKAALGVAAVAAVAVGYSIFSGGNKVDAPNPAVPNNTVEIPQRKVLATTQDKFSAEYVFKPKVDNGNEVKSFIAFPLYSIKGKEGITPLTDDFEIHPGMALGWWKGYSLEDYKLKDGPELDADKDGFTNREEFDGKSNPTDAASHPDYIAKLKSSGAKAEILEMNWTDLNGVQGNFRFKFNGRSLHYGSLGAGGKFPERSRDDESLVERFELLERKQDPAIPGENGQYFLLQDNGENQGKRTFKLYYREKKKSEDWTATLLLDIDGLRDPFTVPEGGSFSLPYDKEAKSKPYTFKSKKGNKAEIEYSVDGEKSTIEIDIPSPK